MRTYWHRRAHLVRQALPGFHGFLDRRGMFALAQRDDVESRLVIRHDNSWELRHGPFRLRELAKLPEHDWTLLAQGVNLHDDRGAALLDRFGFLPHARLDDLMVSYAVPGGGVGPHFDSYDVFLLQGPGRRRWQIGSQADLSLVENLPIKILKRFEPSREWIVESGDMLYLPPKYAHDGVALDECLTYSIGFRAPACTEMAGQFLADLAERVELPGRYADPGVAPTRTPGRLPSRLIDAASDAIRKVRWQRRDVEEFLGRYLSEPKPQVFFDPPASVPGPAAFARLLCRRSTRLHRKSSMLYGSRTVFLNGEPYRFPRGIPAVLRELSDARHALVGDVPRPLAELLREWYASGFIVMDPAA